MIQKGLFYWIILEAVGFFSSRQVISGMFGVFFHYTWDVPVGPRRNHSSPSPDIFCVAVVVDLSVYCASLFVRRTHDTACFINKSSRIDIFHDENMMCL